MNEKYRLNLLYYMQLAQICGYPIILKNSSWTIWTNLIMYVAHNVQGMDLDVLENKEFFLDYAISIDYLDLGVKSDKTVTECLKELERYRLIRVERGGKNAGISRIYFPLNIPLPEDYKISKFILRKYQSNPEYIDKQINYLKDKSVPTDTDYRYKRIDEFKLEISDSKVTIRLKLQAQFLILAHKHGYDITNIKESQMLRGFVTKSMRNIKNHFNLETAISNIHDIEKVENIFVALRNEISKIEPTIHNKKSNEKRRTEPIFEQVLLSKEAKNDDIINIDIPNKADLIKNMFNENKSQKTYEELFEL